MLSPTALIIEDVKRATELGYIPGKDSYHLISALRDGAIEHPIWEDYGLKTLPNGRGASA
jgi:hypothetical protein